MNRIHTHPPRMGPLRPRTKRLLINTAVFLGAILAVSLLVVFMQIVFEQLRPRESMVVGATFSASYVRNLGLEPMDALNASLDELGVRFFRIPAYWNEIEKNNNEFSFEELDAILAAIHRRNGKVVLAVGMRLPRWPECHIPEWAAELSEESFKEELLSMVRTVVTRYRGHGVVVAWQVENEPLLSSFGECPEPDIDLLREEAALVRALDKRPIIVTESGELSTWIRTLPFSDILGISMYRVSWNPLLGYVYYPLSPNFYRQRAKAVASRVRKIIVTELQAEPWVPAGILAAPLSEQYRSMNEIRLKQNIKFVERAGFKEVLLWGIEWWYWLKEERGQNGMWEEGKKIFSESAPVPLIY